MKKYLFTMATAAMLFASCSSDDTVVDNGVNEEGLVEIKLGADSRVGSSVTESRAFASVESIENLNVGIFALDKAGLDWNGDNTMTNRPVYWNNLAANFKQKDLTDPKYYANITTNVEAEKYYPRNTEREYNFYAYSPKADNENVTIGSSSVKVNGTFTGEEDIIWGMSEKIEDAWNPGYIETHGGNPEIAFEHLLSWFVVNVKKGNNYAAATCAIKELSIDHPTAYTLTVADSDFDKTQNEKADVLEFTGNASPMNFYSGTFNPTSTDQFDNIANVFVKSNEKAEFYTLNITLADESKNKVALNIPNDGIEQGKKYNVNIVINGPTDIKITATLEPWGNGDNVTGNI